VTDDLKRGHGQRGLVKLSLEIKKSFVTTGSATLKEVNQGCGGTSIRRGFLTRTKQDPVLVMVLF